MRVIFQSRTTLFSVPGGDTVQLNKTAEYLRNLGVEVDISTELEPDLSAYDLVHLFNLIRPQEVYLQARNAKKQGKPIALSTIFVDYAEYEKRARGGLGGWLAQHVSSFAMEWIKVVARAAMNGEFNRGAFFTITHGFLNTCERIIELTDVFLPNSSSEMKRVLAVFPTAQKKPFVVVPNAVDIQVFDPSVADVDSDVRQFEGCVLSVGRIEGRKCQLELVKAMRDLPFKLVLIGKPAPNHIQYYNSVKSEANDNVYFIDQISQEKLAHFYKVAKVHVLVSWFETTGLSSLEAGAMGCNLVITEKGDTRDYFGDEVYYCDPESIESIKCAIQKALVSPINSKLQGRIRSNYTWQKAAEMTLKGYELVLQNSR